MALLKLATMNIVTWGRGVEEVLESSLHSLDACLSLLLSYLVGKGNMGKPALAVHERGAKERVH